MNIHGYFNSKVAYERLSSPSPDLCKAKNLVDLESPFLFIVLRVKQVLSLRKENKHTCNCLVQLYIISDGKYLYACFYFYFVFLFWVTLSSYTCIYNNLNFSPLCKWLGVAGKNKKVGYLFFGGVMYECQFLSGAKKQLTPR